MSAAGELGDLLERGIAIVRLEAMRKPPGELPLDNIFVDSLAAAHDAVTYLLAHGYRNIAMLGNRTSPGRVRQQGSGHALQTAIGCEPSWCIRCDFTEAGGYAGMQALLALPPAPRRRVCRQRRDGHGRLGGLQAAGLQVPDDIAVMGFDDIPLARL